MIKNKIECPCVIQKFKKHKDIKNKLLSLIDQTDYRSIKFESVETDITKADWHLSNEFRPWIEFLFPYLVPEVQKMYVNLGYSTVLIKEIWFQQYGKDSQHGWHTHGCNFTGVYYVDLPENSPKTEIINPFDQSDIIKLPVTEGDIVCFPSFVLHRAPKNQSDLSKTIISFNLDVDYSEDVYQKNQHTK